MILSETGWLILHKVYKDLQENTSHADHLGISGANTYYCNNYTSPLHCDDDAEAGLCAQFELQAKYGLYEYSFIYADYFASCSNSLWCAHLALIVFLTNRLFRSFSGIDTHGTMLPSTIPLTEKDRTITCQGRQPLMVMMVHLEYLMAFTNLQQKRIKQQQTNSTE